MHLLTISVSPCRGRNVFHAGMARGGYTLGTAAAGEVANKAMETAKGNYLANLVLYPGGQHLRSLNSTRVTWKTSCGTNMWRLPRATTLQTWCCTQVGCQLVSQQAGAVPRCAAFNAEQQCPAAYLTTADADGSFLTCFCAVMTHWLMT
jgi:hypothetical protein